ncbi:MAG: hypothetical protein KKD39_01930 [Candidatus Altiarchaeota archaeon]|nr:hypothetical protein [Candidatus Altiarchaeota archaeon]
MAYVVLALLLVFPTIAFASGYLGPVITFACSLKDVFVNVGNALAAVMFVYGGAKYAYTADDPGGRKQGMAICVAAVMAFLIIAAAEGIIGGVSGGKLPSGAIC